MTCDGAVQTAGFQVRAQFARTGEGEAVVLLVVDLDPVPTRRSVEGGVVVEGARGGGERGQDEQALEKWQRHVYVARTSCALGLCSAGLLWPLWIVSAVETPVAVVKRGKFVDAVEDEPWPPDAP